MKKTPFVLFLLFALAFTAQAGTFAPQRDVCDIRKFGAKGDGKTLNTQAINAAIEACNARGGGVVLVPKGVFVTGTIHLKDNVRLYLEADAVLRATADLDRYESYVPTKDISRFDSGGGGQNANNSRDARWNRALILGVGLKNFAIEGEGTIDGCHVFDPRGEEKMRGPHTIIVAESRNFSMENITVNNAANYAFMAYEIENCTFRGLSINEGWDGIHIRGGKNIVIRDCEFHTGDDAIAGGYWDNMSISDCHINTACNGIRMIMPSTDLTIAHCDFQGPGRYPHRTSRELRRTNMQSAILLQPGGWGRAVGDMDDIHIHDIRIDSVTNPIMMVLNEGNEAGDILVERVTATRITFAAASAESWRGGRFDKLVFRDISYSYAGNDNAALRELKVGQPPADSRQLPCWGWYLRNVRDVLFENVSLTFDGEETRPALWFDNVGRATLRNTRYKTSGSEQGIVSIHTGTIINE